MHLHRSWGLVFAVVVVTSSLGAAPQKAIAPPLQITENEIRELLADAWVVDGKRGFFIDGAHSTRRPAFSLYDTHWQLQLARKSGRDSGVKTTSMQVWLASALDGKMRPSGLPAV